MGIDAVNRYAEILVTAFSEKKYDPLLDLFAEDFEATVKFMGKSYLFTEREKFGVFLTRIPGTFGIKIREIERNEDPKFYVNIAMGLGMLKMPGKLFLELDQEEKIKAFEIK